MEPLTILLSGVKILRNGADGGHLYLSGWSAYERSGRVRAYAFFRDKREEREFDAGFNGQEVTVTSDRWNYLPSIGLTLNDIEWKLEPGEEAEDIKRHTDEF